LQYHVLLEDETQSIKNSPNRCKLRENTPKIAYNQMFEVATTCSVENCMTVDAKNPLS
jgi:hypothetical protein